MKVNVVLLLKRIFRQARSHSNETHGATFLFLPGRRDEEEARCRCCRCGGANEEEEEEGQAAASEAGQPPAGRQHAAWVL